VALLSYHIRSFLAFFSISMQRVTSIKNIVILIKYCEIKLIIYLELLHFQKRVCFSPVEEGEIHEEAAAQ
jgi:hypothetical protein